MTSTTCGSGRSCKDRRLEIVEGALIELPTQGIQSVRPLRRLQRVLERHTDVTDPGGESYTEVDVALADDRVPRPDLVYLTADAARQQRAEEAARPPTRTGYHPIYVTPELIVEAVSVGHEHHDRVTKRRWYAEAGVPHYWLLAHADRSLTCLALRAGAYHDEAAGTHPAVVRTAAFGGLDLPLADVFG